MDEDNLSKIISPGDMCMFTCHPSYIIDLRIFKTDLSRFYQIVAYATKFQWDSYNVDMYPGAIDAIDAAFTFNRTCAIAHEIVSIYKKPVLFVDVDVINDAYVFHYDIGFFFLNNSTLRMMANDTSDTTNKNKKNMLANVLTKV